MKNLYTFLVAVLLTASTFLPQQASAQAPDKMSYQAVVRDNGDILVTNQAVGMRISILQGTASGIAVYEETQTQTTNVNGLVTLEIGTGSVISGDFTTIDWSADSYFIKTETDPTGGSSYTITGTSQLLSVPYALYAKTSGSSIPGPQGLPGLEGPQGPAGLDGTDGIDGVDGADGLDGATGPQGPIGLTGATGPQGPAGLDGANGIDGLDGSDGADGADGANGIDGLDGLDGATGPQGPIGLTGATGPQGPAGNDGADGVGIAQTLSFTSPNLELSDNGGTIDLTALINDADSDSSNEIQNLSQVLTEGNTAGAQLKNITDPTDAQDAATKSYVDSLAADGSETKVTAGTNVIVTGSGTTASPYVVNATGGATLAIGDSYQGGIIFWLDDTGQHGLIAATTDQSIAALWLDTSYVRTNGVRDGIGAGMYNTERIIAKQGINPYAAQLCAKYQGGGYGDWYLPSKYELNLLSLQYTKVGGFSYARYWSSTEYDSTLAWSNNIQLNREQYENKFTGNRVRAIRAF